MQQGASYMLAAQGRDNMWLFVNMGEEQLQFPLLKVASLPFSLNLGVYPSGEVTSV